VANGNLQDHRSHDEEIGCVGLRPMLAALAEKHWRRSGSPPKPALSANRPRSGCAWSNRVIKREKFGAGAQDAHVFIVSSPLD